MKTSCPKCGFTKEPLLSKSLYTVELVRMALYDSFSNNYFTLGEIVGKAWG